MKIVYILPISWGGILGYTAELANAVAKYFDVTVMKPDDANNELFSENVELINSFQRLYFSREKTIKIFSFKNIRKLFSYRNIHIIDKINPDIVHFPAIYPHTSFFAYLYKLDKRYPTICTLHGVHESVIPSPTRSSGLSMAIIDSINDLTAKLIKPNKIIVHTAENKNLLIKKSTDPKQIIVMPHGAFSLFKKYSKDETESKENCILFFGYIIESKGIEYLIKSISIVSKEIHNIKLIIAGEGNFSRYYKYIEDKSRFEIYNDYIPNEMVSTLFQRAKMLILPYTYHEGHSGVLTIAFSFGKPIIITNVGDLPNLVKNGKEGLVVPPKNPEALANAIVRLLKDNKARERMGKNSYNKAQELSWDNIAKRHIEVYKDVLTKGRPI